MLNYGYLGYQAERPKSRAEQREADAQVGQLFAALAQLLCVLAKPVRALRRQSVPQSAEATPMARTGVADSPICLRSVDAEILGA